MNALISKNPNEKLISKATYVWDDPILANQWMKTRHPELGGQTPLEVASTRDGASQVEALLAKLFYGLPV